MNIQDMVQVIRGKLGKHPMAVFKIYKKIHILRAQSQFTQGLAKKYPGMLVGVYNQSATDEMLAEDLEVM
jgi:hypothetical protein